MVHRPWTIIPGRPAILATVLIEVDGVAVARGLGVAVCLVRVDGLGDA